MAQGLLKSNRDRDGLAAALLYNLGDLENGNYEVQEEWQTQYDNFRELEASLEQAGLRRLNGPNLIRNNWWTNRDMPSSAVIVQQFTVPAEDATAAASPLTFTVTNSAITTAYVLHGRWTGNSEAVPWSSITATFAAGSATITVAARSGAHGAVNIKVALCTVANVPVPYGNASRISGTSYPYLESIRSGFYPGDDSEDGCSVTVATLTGDDIITELDGEVFNRALQFSITANTAWGNTEELHFCRPQTNKYTQGSECKDYGQIPEMIPGETYSISFFGRMISGTKAWARCAWGGVNGGLSTFNVDGKCGVSDWIEINGTAWKRYTWPFVFQPTGDWYTETSAVEDGVTKVTRAYNWFKKVSVGISRKLTGVVQLTGFRLVKGKTWITDTYDDINQGLDAVKDRVTALETRATALESRATALESRVTALENGKASSTNPSFSGTLTLDGVTLTPTELAELINSLEEVAPYDPETPAEPVEETEVEPSSP